MNNQNTTMKEIDIKIETFATEINGKDLEGLEGGVSTDQSVCGDCGPTQGNTFGQCATWPTWSCERKDKPN